MTKFRQVRSSLVAAVLGLSAVSTVLPLNVYADTAAKDATAPVEVLRPEIRTALVAAQALSDAKNIPGALAKIAETDSIKDKSPYEIFAVERTRGNYYMTAGDKLKAAGAFEAVVAANYLKRADQLNIMEAISQIYFQESNYPLTISWMNRYLKDGGTDPKANDVLNKAYFLNKDYGEANKGLTAQLNAELAAGKVPPEQLFQLILNCNNQLNDKEGTVKALEQLNTYYPSAKNWTYLISQIHSKPGFSERMYLDVFRLKQELSLMKTVAEYLDMVELATRAALPGEVKKALEQGFAAGVLGKGSDAKKHTALLEAATKHAAEDLKTMDQGEASANKSKDGTGLTNLGMAFATAGQFDKGASLIEQGISKGGLARLEEAKLHLGIVYYWAGKKDQALKQLATVAGTDGTAELARYWIMQINHPLAKQ
ncbi:hypothetical protein AAKU58_004011 [Oxalobacteraceae bacterium GrIS 1.18]